MFFKRLFATKSLEMLHAEMAQEVGRLPAANWYRLPARVDMGLAIHFCYGRHPSTFGKELRGEVAKG